MEKANYRVTFCGKLVAGNNTEEVAVKLASLFGLDLNNHLHAAKLAKLLSSKPVIIKQGLTEETALKYQKAMAHAGALCTVEDMSQVRAESKPRAEKRKEQRRCYRIDRREIQRSSAILPNRRNTTGRRVEDQIKTD